MFTHVRPTTGLATIVAAVLLYPSFSQAQEADAGTLREGRGYVTVGLGVLDLGSLNDRMGLNGYPAFPDRMLAIGGGGHAIRDRWLLGGEGRALIGRTKDATRANQNDELSLTGGAGFFNLGYLIVKRRELHVYPLLGLGAGGIQMKITERASPNV